MYSGTVMLVAELVTLRLVLFSQFLSKYLFSSFGQSKAVFLILLISGETKSCQENTDLCLI